jgi:hypothetical protein
MSVSVNDVKRPGIVPGRFLFTGCAYAADEFCHLPAIRALALDHPACAAAGAALEPV